MLGSVSCFLSHCVVARHIILLAGGPLCWSAVMFMRVVHAQVTSTRGFNAVADVCCRFRLSVDMLLLLTCDLAETVGKLVIFKSNLKMELGHCIRTKVLKSYSI